MFSDAETNMDVDKTVVQAPSQVLSLYGNAKPSPPAEMPSTPTGASPEEAQTVSIQLIILDIINRY